MTPRPGQSLGGRPVTEIVTPVNMGNQPHCDNGEGVAPASPLPSGLKRWHTTIFGSVVRFTDYDFFSPDPSSELLGYCHSSAADYSRGVLATALALLLQVHSKVFARIARGSGP